jgi:hypothetical protein
MGTAWVYVIMGFGVDIRRSSHTGTKVTRTQPGTYVVTFPFSNIHGLAAVATLGASVGTITAVPGEGTGGLSPNEVRVLTSTLDNQAIDLPFSLAVFYQERWWPWLIRTSSLFR